VTFHEATIDTISSMKNLTSYKKDLCYQLTDDVLEIMDNNGLKLKSTEVYLIDNNQVENQFQLLQSSTSTNTLENLSVKYITISTPKILVLYS
jgi:nucleoside diphosphate kinase